MREQLGFLREFTRHPTWTGAIAPSSRWLARVITDKLGLEQADVVVELGPGTGVFTRAIQGRVRAATLHIAVEINKDFAQRVQREFPSVKVVNRSATELPEILAQFDRSHADAIVSGLPWAIFPQQLQHELLDAVLSVLPAGACFATFAYSHGALLPPGQRFRRLLGKRFRKVQRTPVVWRNLPPAFVYRCEK